MVRGRKGAGFTNILGGIGRCVCGAPMRFVRKGSDGGYHYLKCADAVRRKCQHRKLHRYQPVEADVLRLLGEIAFGHAPPDEGQAALHARITRAKRQATEIKNRYNRESAAIGKGKSIDLGAKRLATLDGEHSKKLAEITALERQLQPAEPINEQIVAVQRLIAGLDKPSARERFAMRAKINAGLLALVRGGMIISPAGDVTINLSPVGGPRPYRQIIVEPTVPDGAIELRTADEVMAAAKAGHRVGMAPRSKELKRRTAPI
jgi:hypothetical protein